MSHKRYQPIVPCGNKLLQKKWDDAYFDEHKRRLRSAKPMVDTTAPHRHEHLISKQKKKQLENERAEVINRDNHTLLKKMDHIMKHKGAVDHINTYKHHSLNELKRQRELERVAQENMEMQKRLEKVEPMYKISEWVEDWKKNAELTEMITTYPSITDSSPPTRKKVGIKASPDKHKQHDE